jgi:hypothetical protein
MFSLIRCMSFFRQKKDQNALQNRQAHPPPRSRNPYLPGQKYRHPTTAVLPGG